jgi:5-methylcytosine-specific restriction enzyme subunit McrC
VGDMVNETVMIQNHEIRFATVDMGATAKEIREQLLQVLELSSGISSTEGQHEIEHREDSP